MGDVSRFESQAALAKFAGLHGTCTSQDDPTPKRPLSPRLETSTSGTTWWRRQFVEASDNEEYASYYRKKYSEVPKHQHKVTVFNFQGAIVAGFKNRLLRFLTLHRSSKIIVELKARFKRVDEGNAFHSPSRGEVFAQHHGDLIESGGSPDLSIPV